MSISKKVFLLGAAGLIVVMMLAAALVPRVLADHAGDTPICSFNGEITDGGTIDEPQLLTASGVAGPYSEGQILPFLPASTIDFEGHTIKFKIRILENLGGGLWNVVVFISISDCEPEPIAPAIFLSDVCEPVDGFSSDGWQTWNSDSYAPLFVAASASGPWYQTEFAQPPYVIGTDHAAGLTAWMGAASYGSLWFKAGADGYPVNVGSAVSDRAARMDALCGN